MAYIISELYVYPIKSLAGVSLQKTQITDKGFKYDRQWMLVDENNLFITQRQIPEMALLKIEITAAGLEITHKNKIIEPIIVPYQPETNEMLDVVVWDDTCKALVVSEKCNDWFSENLQMKCKLVYMPEDSTRLVDPRFAHHQENTGFSDGFPFLLIGQGSLDDLNSRLLEKLPMNRFRPNLVISGLAPFEEDTWKKFQVGGTTFFVVKPCARCPITTTNQETAEVGKEPLKTLASYRRDGNKVLFGQNLLHTGNGEVKIGDEVKADFLL